VAGIDYSRGVTTIEPGDSAASRDEQSVLDEARAVIEPLEQRADIEMDALDHTRRILLVHAHPDDESISTGAVMAKYVSEGALVTLITCTLGEEGEILLPGIEHLAADRDDGLGQHRIDELATAMEALRVTDHRFLGGPGRWRDSGMLGLPTNDRPDSFWRADLDEAVGELVRVVREVRPQVVVTYDQNGDYGHPDHIQAHRVTMAAVDAAADAGYRPDAGEPWEIAKVYWTAVPKTFLQAGIDALRESGHDLFEGVESADDLPFGVPDDQVTTQVDATAHLDAKLAALRAHASQISVDGPFFALSNMLGQTAFGLEHFRLVRGVRGAGDGPHGWETDLFAGIG
jgi:N-acetyl-1-D-myo-inositol-2-amino-2-deoxy-alpha-D-glucopyranoside deacetylase